MFYDKNIKAHYYSGSEKVAEILDARQIHQLSKILLAYYDKFEQKLGIQANNFLNDFSSQSFMHFDSNVDKIFYDIHNFTLKEVFLLIELFTKMQYDGYHKLYPASLSPFLEYINDLNNFFLMEKVPFQLIFIKDRGDFYVERIIDEIHSEKIKQTLEKFDKYKKIHQDFKNSIIFFSSGDYKQSIERCCVSIEDYLCIILNKDSCHSIESSYNEAKIKLRIPDDINERLKTLIIFIHKYRSVPLHGSKTVKEPDDPVLINELIIGFTMTILNYLYKLNEK